MMLKIEQPLGKFKQNWSKFEKNSSKKNSRDKESLQSDAQNPFLTVGEIGCTLPCLSTLVLLFLPPPKFCTILGVQMCVSTYDITNNRRLE